MSLNIAIAGKGGVGKTSIAGMIIRQLKKNNMRPILAVDADPNSNLSDTLGLDVQGTIGGIREDFQESKMKIPQGMSKKAYLELNLNKILVESPGLDLLVMGKREGHGCYCSVNHILREFIDLLSENYPYVIVDNEAGLEHLSRRTTRDVDIMLIISDHSVKGVRTAGRINRMAEELELNVKKSILLINRVSNGIEKSIEAEIKECGVELGGTIPEDNLLNEYDIRRKSLLDLPDDSRAVVEIDKIISKFFL